MKNKPIMYPDMNAKSVAVGQRYQNNRGGWYTILSVGGCMDIAIKFDAGDIHFAQIEHLKRGSVKSAYDKSVYGVGYMGEGMFPCTVNGKRTRLYLTWSRMLQRCYCEAVQKNQPAYVGCEVCERWHNFQNFAADAHYLPGFEEWYEAGEGSRWALDKDGIVEGNKVYGPDACQFLSQTDNTKIIWGKL